MDGPEDRGDKLLYILCTEISKWFDWIKKKKTFIYVS